MMRKMAYVCRKVSMRFAVAMAISSQNARIMASCGDIVVDMKRIMGSSAGANSVIESGQPCFTPEVKRMVSVRMELIKMVWRLSW